jgi:transcriptional regulator with XRE-family HTH domain
VSITTALAVPTRSRTPTIGHIPRLTRLKLVRDRQALTQRELAERAGVAETTSVRLERYGLDARASTVRKLARALTVRPDELMAPLESDSTSTPTKTPRVAETTGARHHAMKRDSP